MKNSQVNVQVKTPSKRFLAGGMIGNAGVLLAQIVPQSLLLPFKLMELNPKGYTSIFGYILGIAAVVALIAGPIWGVISDRTVTSFGRRKIWILVGGIGGALPLLGIGLAKSVSQILVCWVISSFFFAANWALNPTLVADQVDEGKRGTYGGITGFITPFGTVLGLILMSLLPKQSLFFKFNLCAVICIVCVIIQLIIIQEGRLEYTKPVKEKHSFGEFVSQAYPSPRKFPAFSWGLITRMLVCTLGNLGTYYTIMLLQRYHFTQADVTSKVTLISMTSILFLATASILGGIISDKLRKQKIIVIGSSIFFILAFGVQAFASNFNIFFIGACMASFAYGVFICVDMALMIRILPNKENAGKDMAIINLPSGFATPIVSFVSPAILSFTNWTGYFGIFAVVAFSSIFTMIPIPEMTPKPVE